MSTRRDVVCVGPLESEIVTGDGGLEGRSLDGIETGVRFTTLKGSDSFFR